MFTKMKINPVLCITKITKITSVKDGNVKISSLHRTLLQENYSSVDKNVLTEFNKKICILNKDLKFLYYC